MIESADCTKTALENTNKSAVGCGKYEQKCSLCSLKKITSHHINVLVLKVGLI